VIGTPAHSLDGGDSLFLLFSFAPGLSLLAFYGKHAPF